MAALQAPAVPAAPPGGAGSEGEEAAEVRATGEEVQKEVQTLYTVLRLASPENSHRWVDVEGHGRALDAGEGEGQCAGPGEGSDDDEGEEGDPLAPSPAAVSAFTRLLVAAARRAARAGAAHRPQRFSLVAAFVTAAQREVSHALGPLGVRRVQEHRGDLALSAQASAYGCVRG